MTEVLARYPKTGFKVQADVTNEVSVVRAVEESVRKFGPIHVLVVNHGIWPSEDVLVKDLSPEVEPHDRGQSDRVFPPHQGVPEAGGEVQGDRECGHRHDWIHGREVWRGLSCW